jgi:hypothetical protein
MTEKLPILHHGHCEGFKASVHGVVLGAAALCAVYNSAAWLARRQRHSAVNAAVYTVLAIWEATHVQHHVECHPSRANRTREQVTAA